MKRFLLKLIAPRPTFAQDMTEAERMIMRDHVAYWTDLKNKGVAVAFGPVIDPKGVWGVAIVEVTDDAVMRTTVSADPVSKARLGSIEVYPMGPGTIVRN